MWVALLSCGCSSGTGGTDTAGTADAVVGEETSEEPVAAVTSATPGVPEATLDESHEGWSQANCAACHQDPHRHGQGLESCARCHGSNGAPPRPAGHASEGCATCHQAPHPDAAISTGCTHCHVFVPVEDGCPATEEADVVVIGAGGGGLGAAATLARAGLDVILLEQHNRVGGYMTSFRRGDYNFEVSLHAMDGLDDGGGINRTIFEAIGIWEKIKPIRMDPMYRVIYPDFELLIPADPEEYRALLKETFPDEATGVDELWDEMYLFDEALLALLAAQMGDAGPYEQLIEEQPDVLLRVQSYMEMPLTDALLQWVEDPRVHTVWTQLAGFAGTEPDRISAFMFFTLWCSYHFHGFYYFEGGSAAVAEALAEVVTENGGRIHFDTRATRIVVQEGRATEVQTEKGPCYRADYVVSNANAQATLLEMVGPDHLPEDYVAKVQGLDVGLSAFAVYLGVDKDFTGPFEGSHEIMITSSYDQHENFSFIPACDVQNAPYAIANYSAVDPTAAPPGKNVLQVISQFAYEWNDEWKFYQDHAAYQAFREEVALELLARAEQVLPGLSEHIEYMEIATPLTLKGFTLNPRGTIFGWDNTIEQSVMNRLQQQTPIPNLFLAGAWTFPGGGQSAVILSGFTAAAAILADIEAQKEP